jgi:TorA maturation chaperone TorD
LAEAVSQNVPITIDQSSTSLMDDNALRSNTYSVLSALLSQPPSGDLLDYLNHINTSAVADDSDDSNPAAYGQIGQAWLALRDAARSISLKNLNTEYHSLFIGIGRGEIVPFGSWHITGFLMEKPLSDLRDDLRSLGIESDSSQKDPEDHIAALCETMAILIQSEDISEAMERQFFIRHIHPWASKFFNDLAAARSASFYKSVSLLGQLFMDLESDYLNIQTH